MRLAHEILVQWSNGVTMTTGTFLDNGVSVHTVNPAPDFSGTLLVSRPEYSFYVYQQYGELYWLCGDSFPFEEDGTTYNLRSDVFPANTWLIILGTATGNYLPFEVVLYIS